ncbi:MAG: alanine racemase [Wenzhouxiangella sp.]
MNQPELVTPCLLLDPDRMNANIDRMASHLDRLGVALRPHVKTAKNVEIGRRLITGQPGGITVSTLAEADHFFRHGFDDILYAVGIAPGKLPAVARRIRQGMKLTLILDHPDTAHCLARAADEHRMSFDVLLEVDADEHRAGFRPDDPALLETARLLDRGDCRVGGVLVHAGGSYDCSETDGIRKMAERERDAALEAARALRENGFPAPVTSIGSTPTATFAEDLSGITEVRAGVHVFQDLVQAGLGVCAIEDIAVSVLTEVIGHRAREGQAIVDAGWMALSRDRGTADQAVDQGYGLICDESGTVIDDTIVIATNQEHGIVGHRDGHPLDLAEFPIGRRLRVLPNHACATSAQHDGYWVVDGRQIPERWLQRCRGWTQLQAVTGEPKQ